MTPTETLIQNERTTLLANAFDRASTASLVVGVFGPLATVMYGTGVAPDLTLPSVWVFSILWLTAAFWLHALARQVLKRLL